MAHRLLKNNVPGKEYLLFTDNYIQTQNDVSLSNVDKLDFETNVEHFENFGEVSTKFINFSPLLKFIPTVSGLNKFKQTGYAERHF